MDYYVKIKSTIGLNILLIPKFHYWGAAIATFSCYLFMMIVSYVLGQKYYPVPYAKKKMIAYLVLVSLIVLTHRLVTWLYSPLWFSIVTGSILLAGFAYFVLRIEKKELIKIPYLNKFIR